MPEQKTVTLETPDYGDAEINAMGQLHAALEPLSEEARRRALKWVGERYELEMEVRG